MHTGLGLHITRRLLGSGSGASALLAGETDGLAFDFTNQSALIRDTSTPANAYNSIGIVNDGELVGPSGKLTYTSPSNKLTLQSDGYYKYQAHNLALDSEDITATGWNQNAMTRSSADTALETTANQNHYVFRTTGIPGQVVGTKYFFQVEVKGIGRDWAYLSINDPSFEPSYFNISGAGALGIGHADNAEESIIALEDGWYRISMTKVILATTIYPLVGPATADGMTTYVGDVTKGLQVRKFQVTRVPANTDYIKTTSAAKYALPIEYDTSGNCLGLLVEEQRTNLYANNSTPSTYATPDYTTLTDNYATSPQGITNAHRLVCSAIGAPHRIFKTSLSAGLTSYTISCYIKAVDTSGYYIGIREDSTTGAGAVFDPANGFSVVGTYATSVVSAVSASVEDVGNGWYRIIASYTSTSMTIGAGLTFVDPAWTSGNFYSSWDPGATKEIHFWALQAESGAFPSSPIITYGSALARAADNISIATSAFPYSGAAGTLYACAKTVNNTSGTAKILASLDDGTSNERTLLWYHINDPKALIVDGGSIQLDQDLGTWAVDTNGKIALAYALNDCSSVFDGGTVYSDTSATMPTVDRLSVGSQVGSSFWNSHIKAISYVPRRKDDIELAVDTGYSLPTEYASYGAWDLFGDESSALAFDFTDQSVVNTKTPLVSQGIVSDGELVGPGAALTYTSPSNKLTRQSDGYYKYQAHNLCLQSENLSTTWTNLNTTDAASGETPPSPYTTAYTLTDNGTNGRHILYQQLTLVSGASYTASVAVKAGTATHAAITLDGGSANAYAVNVDLSDGSVTDTNTTGTVTNPSSSVTDLGGGWYRVDVSIGAVNGGVACYFTVGLSNSATPTWATASPSYTGTGSTVHVTGCALRRTPSNDDYIRTTSAAKYALPLEYDTSGNCLGLLVEEARTNVIPYSTTTAQWAALNLTASANSTDVVDIFGLNGATKLTGSGGSAAHLYFPLATPSLSAATNYVCSIYVKAGTLQYIQLLLDGTPFGLEYANFDIQNGTATGSDSGTLVDYGIEDAGNGWYRLWIVDTSGSTTASPIMYVAPLLVGNETYNPTLDVDGLTFYVMQADCQAGSFPTSPILTYGSALARNADNISISGTAFPWNGDAGSFVAKYKPIALPATGQFVFCADGADDYDLLAPSGLGELNARVDGTAANLVLDASYTDLDEHIVALANDATSFYGSLDGAAVVTDASSLVASSSVTFYIGSRNTAAVFNGAIKYIAFVPRKWSESETITKATP